MDVTVVFGNTQTCVCKGMRLVENPTLGPAALVYDHASKYCRGGCQLRVIDVGLPSTATGVKSLGAVAGAENHEIYASQLNQE